MTATASQAGAWQQAWSALAAQRSSSRVRRTNDDAFERFTALGFPTTRDEDWRFTSVAVVARAAFAHADAVPTSKGPVSGARVESLRTALEEWPALVEPHLARIASFDRNAFVALNTAFLRDGILVHVPKGVVVTEPIEIAGPVIAGDGPVAAHPRVLVVLDEGAQATIVETHAGAGEGCLSNAVTEVELGPGAHLRHVHVQRQPTSALHFVTTAARLGRDATFASHVISLGASLSRHDLRVELLGEGSSCTLDGLSSLDGSQHADHHTHVDHAVPHCTSAELYKGAYAGRSRGVFTGRVVVRKGAQKTVAHQRNENLLLSEEALVDTLPQLEILADDVRCTHGATIGRLDDDQLFYLRSRGVGGDDARSLLTAAFASGIVARIPVPALRDELESLLAAKRSEARRTS